MSLKKTLQENVIDPYTSQIVNSSVEADVLAYDNKRNTATIIFKNPRGAGYSTVPNVQIQSNSPGLNISSPVGLKAIVNFTNGSLLKPKIIGFIDKGYMVNTRSKFNHIKCGSLIPSEILNERMIYNRTNIINDWFDEDNTNINKYARYSGNNINIFNEFNNKLESIGNYDIDEIGLTHFGNGSTVKINTDGSINIFTNTNIGIKISPSTKTINFIGDNINSNCDNWTVTSNNINIKAKNISIESNVSIKGKVDIID